MTRAEAWEQFQAAHKQEQEQLRQAFWDHLQDRLGQLMECIYGALDDIGKQAEEQEKDDCMYFLFSLLRCGMTENKATVRLDVTNLGWYLDEEPLTAYFQITFLFQEYFDWKEQLLLDMREYRGKVNKYDVCSFIQDEIMVCNQLITHILRFAFRNLEEQEAFKRIGRLLMWIIRWGEYKDYSEIAMQVNREVRGGDAWLDKLQQYEEKSDILMAEYWYQENLTSGDCREKVMYFITFEECTLKGIDFTKADLTGARFLRCRIEDCDFTQAVLRQSEFEDCVLSDNNFRDAILQQAVFSEESFQSEAFDEKQLEELLVAEQPEEEEA